MNTANSTKPTAVWIDTHRVTLAVMEDTTSYSEQTLSQGRDSQVKVPRFSMLAGTPVAPFRVNWTALSFWAVYILGLASAVAWAVLKVKAGGSA